MRLRESGMPEEARWESLFNVDLILDRLNIDSTLNDILELGCGFGTFTVPIAKRISGTLHAFDIEEDMVGRTKTRCAEAGLKNVICEVRDVAAEGFGVLPESKDGCVLFNILHGENPIEILAESAKRVRPGAKVFVIHWRCDLPTPRGPSLDIRPRAGQIISWAEETGTLRLDGTILDLPPWHFGLGLVKSPPK